MNTVPIVAFLTQRNGPGPSSGEGLTLALLLVVLLLAHQLRTPWAGQTPPGPVRARLALPTREGVHLYWAVVLILLADLVIVVIERFVLLS